MTCIELELQADCMSKDLKLTDLLRKTYLILFLILPITVNAGSVQSVSWPMYNQNPAHTGYINVKLAKKFKLDWSKGIEKDYESHANIIFQPIIDNNLIYISKNADYSRRASGMLQILSADDGHQVWEKPSNGDTYLNSPSISNKLVYTLYHTPEYNSTVLYGLDVIIGQEIFANQIDSSSQHNASPVVFEDTIYIQGGKNGGMYSFDAKTGALNWNTDFSQENINLKELDSWIPAVNEKYVVGYYTKKNTDEAYLIALNRLTGKLTAKIIDPHYKNDGDDDHEKSRTSENTFASYAPVIIDDDKVLSVHSGHLSMFNLTQNKVEWSIGSRFRGNPVFDGDYIYVPCQDARGVSGLCILDKSGKLIKATFYLGLGVMNVLVTKNLIFISNDFSATYAISKETHEVIWSEKHGGWLSIANGHLYILARDGSQLTSISIFDWAPPSSNPAEQLENDFHSTKYGTTASCSATTNEVTCNIHSKTSSINIDSSNSAFTQMISNIIATIKKDTRAENPTNYTHLGCYLIPSSYQVIYGTSTKYAKFTTVCDSPLPFPEDVRSS